MLYYQVLNLDQSFPLCLFGYDICSVCTKPRLDIERTIEGWLQPLSAYQSWARLQNKSVPTLRRLRGTWAGKKFRSFCVYEYYPGARV